MMHCTMDDVLALAAGEGSAWARQHVAGCAACRAELEALYQRVARLKALPARRPARDRWPAVRDAVLAERRRRRERWGVSGLAAAAALAGLLVFRPFWTKPVDAAELARVKQQSATLEQQLGRYDPDGRRTGDPRARACMLSDHRGRIGVVVKTDASPGTDKIGAKIEGVTPGGPADKAGLKVRDIITKFNGTSLAAVKPEDEDESGPGRKLVELARKLEPDDTVQVEYRRGNDTKQATLVAANMGGMSQWEIPGPPDVAVAPMLGMDRFELMGSPWGDLELVSLNSDLGEYFGAKDGVLVVRAPADSSLPLKGGDVITSIGGRKPANPSHAMRILRSYETGETVSIEILRKQKRMSLTWKVPAREDRFFRMHREREEHQDQSRLRHLQLRRRVHLQRA